MSLLRIRVVTLILMGLWAGASLAVGLPRSLHNPDAQALNQLLLGEDGCPQPCWEGIEPGISSSTEAIARLNAMPSVTEITAIQGIVTNDSIIRWRWTGKQSGIIDGERGGTIWLHKGLVYSIELPLKATFATVWQAVGKPEQITMAKAPREKPSVEYHALYAEGLVDLYGESTCPLKAWTLLGMPVDAHLASEIPLRVQTTAQPTLCH